MSGTMEARANDRRTGPLQCDEMVLESIARRCRDLGGIRTIQGWRTRYEQVELVREDTR